MPDFHFSLSPDPLDPARAISAVSRPHAGGIALFLGTTRAETHPTLGPLLHLDYHAYPEMAEKETRRLFDAAAGRWPLLAAAIHHRLGPVDVGQPSIVIAVATPHRADAFDACRYLIDQLKATVPIWKREHYQHSARWQAESAPHTAPPIPPHAPPA
ncbi:MAG TPA: molybdenum cofactor biosynthesis protein MoaE [Phycisphaerae bacterium]|nr:molybdenum cofactor biosynthesis protein MoaE [Phycisphaerae bacterium]